MGRAKARNVPMFKIDRRLSVFIVINQIVIPNIEKARAHPERGRSEMSLSNKLDFQSTILEPIQKIGHIKPQSQE